MSRNRRNCSISSGQKKRRLETQANLVSSQQVYSEPAPFLDELQYDIPYDDQQIYKHPKIDQDDNASAVYEGSQDSFNDGPAQESDAGEEFDVLDDLINSSSFFLDPDEVEAHRAAENEEDSSGEEEDVALEDNVTEFEDEEEAAQLPTQPMLFHDHDFIAEVFAQLQMQFTQFNDDDDDLLHNTIDDTFYIGSTLTSSFVIKDLTEFICQQKFTIAQSKSLLAKLKLYLPVGARLPETIDFVEQTSRKKCHISVFKYDCCPCGATVYVGANANLQECISSKCTRLRYTDASKRYSAQKIRYRSLVLLLCELLSTEGFMTAIDCQSTHKAYTEGAYVDILDGKVAKRHLEEMKARFDNYPNLEDNNYIHLPILLSFSYDGVQLFKRRHQHYWPMLISILNLPPPLRKLIGVGLFTLSMLVTSPGSNNERFAFECFIKELNILNDGIILPVRGKTYLLQARLIVHCYDTPALQDILKVEGHNSCAGCSLCLAQPGWGKSVLGVTSYQGHRHLLPLRHYLRMYGQSRKCCPDCYFTNQEDRNKNIRCWQEELLECFPSDKQPEARWVEDLKDIKVLNPCDQIHKKAIYRYLGDADATFEWFNPSPYLPWRFRDYLFYHHCDFRPYHPYKRVCNEEYRSYGVKAIENRKPYRGSKGVWIFEHLPYAKVEENICYDPFHCLYDIAKNLLTFINGSRAVSRSTIMYCKVTKCHPSLWFGKVAPNNDKQESEEYMERLEPKQKKQGKSKATKKAKKKTDDVTPMMATPWLLSNSATKVVEESLAAVYLPPRCKDNYKVRGILTDYHTYQGVQLINFIECAMDYFTMCIATADTSYAQPYLLFYSFVSSLFSALLSPIVFDETINHLFNRTAEFVSVHDGMFPPSESLMIYHQLIHLVKFINMCGPLRNFWTLPSERALCTIKRNVVKKGRSWEAPASRKQFAQELSKLSTTYSTQDLTQHSECFTRLPGDRIDMFKYSDFKFKLFNDRQSVHYIQLTNYEKDRLLLFLVDELKRLEEDEHTLYFVSLLYRMHKSYEFHKISMETKCIETNKKTRPTFYEFICTYQSNIYTENGLLYKKKLTQEKIVSKNLINGRLIPFQDLQDATELDVWLSQPISVYNKAFIWGVQLDGRGETFRETNKGAKKRLENHSWAAFMEFEPSNEFNNLNLHYGTKPGSWCKVFCHQDGARDKFKAGQLNCFFQVLCPKDALIDKLCIASVTMRKTKLVERRKEEENDYDDNFYENLLEVDCDNTSINYNAMFTSVYNISPTPMAMAAWKDSKPVILKDGKALKKSHGNHRPNKLYLYALSRSRECIFSTDCLNVLHPYYTKSPMYKELAWGYGD